jgi:hypothetical protein
MSCPEDDAFARLTQGLATTTERAELERHLDDCEACTELWVQLGRVNHAAAPSSEGVHDGNLIARRGPDPWLLAAELLLVALCASWWLTLGSLRRAGLPDRMSALLLATDHALAARWIGSYFAVWPPIGALLGVVNVVGLARRSAWARASCTWSALLSLPSLLLLPLGAFVLLSRERADGP